MNRRLFQVLSQPLQEWAGLLAGLALVIETSGCASSRPAPLLVRHPAFIVPKDPDDGLNLKVVTYNIWGLPSWLTGASRGRYPKIARELERLDPDIILLQEAWTASARKSAPANSGWAIARAAGQHTFFQQSGLVTLSRYPVIGGRFYPFARAAFPDRLVNKGVLKVTVRLPGEQVLNVWNVHLQDGGSPEVRLSQIRELIAKVQSAEDGQVADLVGGDFNCTPQSTFYRELESSLGPSVQELSRESPFVTWDGLSAKPGAGQTLDYIFVRQHVRSSLPQAASRAAFTAANFEQRLSDHIGVEAVVNLDPARSLARGLGPLAPGGQLQAVAARQAAYADQQ